MLRDTSHEKINELKPIELSKYQEEGVTFKCRSAPELFHAGYILGDIKSTEEILQKGGNADLTIPISSFLDPRINVNLNYELELPIIYFLLTAPTHNKCYPYQDYDKMLNMILKYYPSLTYEWKVVTKAPDSNIRITAVHTSSILHHSFLSGNLGETQLIANALLNSRNLPGDKFVECLNLFEDETSNLSQFPELVNKAKEIELTRLPNHTFLYLRHFFHNSLVNLILEYFGIRIESEYILCEYNESSAENDNKNVLSFLNSLEIFLNTMQFQLKNEPYNSITLFHSKNNSQRWSGGLKKLIDQLEKIKSHSDIKNNDYSELKLLCFNIEKHPHFFLSNASKAWELFKIAHAKMYSKIMDASKSQSPDEGLIPKKGI